MGTSIIKEFAATLGLDVNAASFLKGQVAFKLIETAAMKFVNFLGSAVRALPEMTMELIQTADAIDELSQSAGISAKQLQEVSYVAGFSGLTMNDVARSFGFFSKSIVDATNGSKEAAKAFKGIDLTKDGKARDTVDILADLADKFKGMADGAEKVDLAKQIFGKSGQGWIPVLNQGSQKIREMVAEFHALGLEIDDATIKMGAEGADAIDKFGLAWKGVKKVIAKELLPIVVEAAKAFVEWWKNGGREKFITGLKTVLKILGIIWRLIAPLLEIALGLFQIIAGLVEFLLDNKDLLVGALMGVALAFAVVKGAAIAAAITTAQAWILANLPILLMIAAVAFLLLLFEDVKTWIEGGDSLIGRMLGPWEEFKKSMTEERAGDPWWLMALKGALNVILNIREAWASLDWENIKSTVQDLWGGGHDLNPWAPRNGRRGEVVAGPAGWPASVPVPSSKTSNSTTAQIKIEVNAGSGAEGQKIGEEIETRLNQWWSKTLTHATAGVK